MIKQKATIVDIAAKAGVSISTVSRVLNGKSAAYRIGKESQKKVRDAAKELNFIPNQFASNLKSGKSDTVALMVPSLSNPFFAHLSSIINIEVRKYGYTTIIVDSDENLEIEKMELRQVVSRNIEGLIIVPCGNHWEHIRQVYDQGLPIICIDRYFEELDISYVSTDNYYGACLATKHLIENGHTRIACIQGVLQSTPNKLRIMGFKDSLENAGIGKYSIVGNDFSEQNGYLETRLLFQQKETPTAIFALSNTIALGCMKALKEMNLSIPEEISLITFDDHPYLDYLSTPVSCIAQPVSDISKVAVKFLFSKINGMEDNVNQILIKPVMMLRKSIRSIS